MKYFQFDHLNLLFIPQCNIKFLDYHTFLKSTKVREYCQRHEIHSVSPPTTKLAKSRRSKSQKSHHFRAKRITNKKTLRNQILW